ncbi:transglycosylase domain-containing protein [Streptomyces violascens]|uniref:Uncharacterized protein n=1 Tax=Streptomyces violascens TaxID=67381 RepID=A0ABQ3QTU4_9ACTN|nr:transglycosylase domain-containing protein [Streptomyces violascens]GHI40663.1 hypothetical protein Sviol_50710 [Streptomyces violascens]
MGKRQQQESRENPARRQPQGRGFVDYPRRGRRGLRRWLPSWRLVLGAVAARAYYGIPARRLDPGQGAALAALLQGAELYEPATSPSKVPVAAIAVGGCGGEP